ncbi:DNA repair protein [Sulfitobacter sp. M57]|uniref:DNA repair protein n=1 Tax=unclassified Sulfitobacter TaxID=196795 RepID=UPI0023E0CFCF|nr:MULTISPECIES: DNA repair protein [unclassified Sulfitobacter]MDF3420722.1 DNA repair protein [Sulfitobacter sp. KE43]MDF3413997.1 DNA repair protein [Sulfitobacter sp. KE5]MDF3432543.1 DNA repair protein [Sulfitobacter sp. KE42]MDF3458182.1 DNA repair protein [Sulfitobacter sp. S74]MDF3462083.1 DNA repair protein [Sulfitobacter sp. Ks18]
MSLSTFRTLAYFVQFLLQRLAFVVFLFSALALIGASAMAALGLWSWIDLNLGYQGQQIENAGMYVQIGLSILALGLCFFLPSNRRIMVLENSHRRFSIGMQDVAQAYSAAHAADRAETFQLSSEFDAVRERLAYLRDHPDLSTLEPALLEVAAQMSHISRELAEVYSDDKIARARSFLKERQQEIALFNSRLEQAKGISTDLKHWLHEVELEESVAVAQLERLRAEMQEILPELGLESRHKADQAALDNTIVDLQPKAAE